MKKLEGKKQKGTAGSSFKLSIVQDLNSLNPHQMALNLRGLALGKWIFEGLTRLNLEGEYELAGAEEVKISPCKTEYTFTLRSTGYSDGTIVSAYDYEESWKKAISPDSPCTKANFFYCIKNAEKAKKKLASLDTVGVKALDEKTLFVKLEHPTPYFFSLAASPLFAPFKMKGDEVLANGPYIIEEWKKGDYMKLKANPFFWDRGGIRIQEAIIYIIANAMTSLCMYEKEELDWVGGPFNWFSSDILTKGIADGFFFKEEESIQLPFWVRLNTAHFPLSSPFIRRALSCVINRNEIAEHILKGDEPLFTPFPNAQFLKPSVLVDNDYEKGNALFEKGLEELGLTRETFPPLKISVIGLGVIHKRVSEYLQEKWEAVLGIQVDLDVQELADFYSRIAKNDYQAAGYFISVEHNDPAAYLEFFCSSSSFSNWKSPEYMQVIDKIRQEKDLVLRKGLLKEAEELLHKGMPIIWVANRSQYHSYRSDLKGLCFDHLGLPDLRWAYLEE